jgi:hypothetical protein
MWQNRGAPAAAVFIFLVATSRFASCFYITKAVLNRSTRIGFQPTVLKQTTALPDFMVKIEAASITAECFEPKHKNLCRVEIF